jgi:hypothetical protein
MEYCIKIKSKLQTKLCWHNKLRGKGTLTKKKEVFIMELNKWETESNKDMQLDCICYCFVKRQNTTDCQKPDVMTTLKTITERLIALHRPFNFINGTFSETLNS